LLELVDAALDNVPVLVSHCVEGGWPAADGASAGAVGLLIGGFRDGCVDAASAQAAANGAAGVRHVGEDPARAGTRPTWAASVDADAVHHRVEHDRIVALAGRDDPSDRPAPAVCGEVDLRGQPTAGTPQRFAIMVVSGVLVIRRSPLWCTAAGVRGAPAAC